MRNAAAPSTAAIAPVQFIDHQGAPAAAWATGLGALGVHAISKPQQVAGVTVHRVRLPNHNSNDNNADKTMWLLIGGAIAAVVGVADVQRGGRAEPGHDRGDRSRRRRNWRA